MNEEHVGIFNGGIDGGGVGDVGGVGDDFDVPAGFCANGVDDVVKRLIGGIVFDGNGCLPDFATSIANELVDFTLEEELAGVDDG